jgi:molybdopterin-guanine dinucleotide biosynthesis protein A
MCLCHDERVTSRDVSAAIVAGGQARRFGGADKSRLLVDGRAIIVRQLEVLQRITPSVMIIANDPTRFADLAVPVRPDLLPGTGALGGLYTALVQAPADRVLVVACDLPHLHEGLLTRLTDLAASADGAWVRTARGPEPFLACYRRHAAEAVRRALDLGRLRAGDLETVLDMAVLDEAGVAAFGPVARLLANVNSPEDYARVQ